MEVKHQNNLKAEINKYKWYHSIQVEPGIVTPSRNPQFKGMWDFNLKCMREINFRNKRVLDIGCRDGLFSFEAEKRGASEVIGIDNNLSRGAVECLIPKLKSKVRMIEMNVYDLTPESFGKFDIILFFGVLYHLRYPFWGLKKITDCLEKEGILAIESGMLMNPSTQSKSLLYCPVEESPYERTSCTFFNKKGLNETLKSFAMKLNNFWTFEEKGQLEASHTMPFSHRWKRYKEYFREKNRFKNMKELLSDFKIHIAKFYRTRVKRVDDPSVVARQFYIFQKFSGKSEKFLNRYWNETHKAHC